MNTIGETTDLPESSTTRAVNGFRNEATWMIMRWIDEDKNATWHEMAYDAVEASQDAQGPSWRMATIRLADRLAELIPLRLEQVDWYQIASTMVDAELVDWEERI